LKVQSFTKVVAAAVCICAMVVLSACGDKSTSPPQPVAPHDSVNWVGSGVVYDTSIVKKDHSAIFFMVSWCSWCNKLKKETLTDTAVVRILNESFNSIRIDPDADSLVQYNDTLVSPAYLTSHIYGVSGYPEIDLFDRAGVRRGRLPGFRSAATLAQELRQFLSGK
jgi:thioredoxin-related protein